MSPLSSTSDKIYRELQFLLVNFAAAATEFPGDSIYCDNGPALAGTDGSVLVGHRWTCTRGGAQMDLHWRAQTDFCHLHHD